MHLLKNLDEMCMALVSVAACRIERCVVLLYAFASINGALDELKDRDGNFDLARLSLCNIV